jgi:hypothetical protein
MKRKQKTKNNATMILILIAILITTTSANIIEQPQNPIYAPNQEYQFGLTWTSINGTEIIFKHNFSGIEVNETTIIYENETNTYWFNIDDLSAGMYNYEWEIKNETDTINITANYEIQKAQPTINLSVDGKNENVTINESDTVNITARIDIKEGRLELLINDEIKNTTINQTENRTITHNKKFTEPGIYEIKARYNETENYTSKEIILEVTVQESLIIQTNKDKYNLGEQGIYYLYAPLGTIVEIEICKNDTINIGFTKCYSKEQKPITEATATLEKDGKKWTSITLDKTLKPTLHELRAKISGTEITRTTTYDVIDNMILETSGKTKLKLNEETTLKATIKGGITPHTYTWTLPDGTTRTGSELKIKYATEGNREIKITAKDKEGNTKEEKITLDVRPYYDLTIEIKNLQNQVIKDAIITIGDEKGTTDNTGKTKFNLAKDEYNIKIDAEGYRTKTETIDLNAVTSMTIKLEQITTTNTGTTDKIKLDAPTNKATISTAETEFKATLNLDQTSTCKLFITDKNNQWFIELARKENAKTGTLTFKEKIEAGEYRWKISCESQNAVHESEIREFSITRHSTSITDNTIDAGELRRQIEEAHENLDKLGLEARKVADALDVAEMLRVALRDYERVLRDLNSLTLRRDLTDAQKREKVEEYTEVIKELEKTTPYKIEVLETEEYITHANKEELAQIITQYAKERNIQGRPDHREIENEQNNIRTRTFTAQATITYLNRQEEDITIIHKIIEYTKETSRHHFILENIPEEINTDITIKQSHDIIKRNKLIRFERPEIITYTLQGHQDLETTKKIHTIILSEGSYKATSTGSTITGMVTFTNMNLEPTTILVIILILLIIAYVFYAFDVKEKIKEQIQGFGKDKKIKEIMTLINDAKDYLEEKNLDRAKLIYKEIKLMYEKAPRKVKNKIYEDAIALANILNETYIEYLIIEINASLKEKNKQEAIDTYNKLIDAYHKSGTETQRTFHGQIIKLSKEIREQ